MLFLELTLIFFKTINSRSLHILNSHIIVSSVAVLARRLIGICTRLPQNCGHHKHVTSHITPNDKHRSLPLFVRIRETQISNPLSQLNRIASLIVTISLNYFPLPRGISLPTHPNISEFPCAEAEGGGILSHALQHRSSLRLTPTCAGI